MTRIQITKADAHLNIKCAICGKPAQFYQVRKSGNNIAGCYRCFVR